MSEHHDPNPPKISLRTEEEIEKHQELYGPNVFELPLPSFVDLLKKQFMGPIVIFQLFCSVLWALDTYWKYTAFTLLTIIGFEASTAFQKLKSMMQLRTMSGKTYDIFVFRRGRWITQSVSELLPGDLISLSYGGGANANSNAGASGTAGSGDAASGTDNNSAAAGTDNSKTDNTNTANTSAPKPPAVQPSMSASIPCDCVILQGTAVVNEASLTGESVPQMKDSLNADDGEESLDMHGHDKIHVLYSGTTLIQTKNNALAQNLQGGDARQGSKGSNSKDSWVDLKDDGTTTAGCDDDDDCDDDGNNGNNKSQAGFGGNRASFVGSGAMPAPPDHGIICYVIRTGFSSSQGELMRMIEFSQENVSADKKETALQILFLFCFALCAAGYVLKKGLEDPERPTYKVLLKCVLIITQVVPPSLPMQMAFAVHTALMSLTRSGIFCTEPFRVPEAGKIRYCFFDKTGTLTSDQMHGTGMLLAKSESGGNKASKKRSSSIDESDNKKSVVPKMLSAFQTSGDGGPGGDSAAVLAMHKHDNHMAAFVLGSCHSIMEVAGRMCGDPIEIAALRGIEWSFETESNKCYPGAFLAKQKALNVARDIMNRETDARRKQELGADVKELEDRLAAEQAKSRMAHCEIKQRFHFNSKLQRMSTLCRLEVNRREIEPGVIKAEALADGGAGGKNQQQIKKAGGNTTQKTSDVAKSIRNNTVIHPDVKPGNYAFVKGSPEMILSLLKKEKYRDDLAFVDSFNTTYRKLAEQGQRVLALAYRNFDEDDVSSQSAAKKKSGSNNNSGKGNKSGGDKQLAELSALPREEIEQQLEFAGLATYKCETRKDSKIVIRALNQSAHKCIMLTGDAALTGYSVAKEVRIASRKKKALILSDDATHWKFAEHADEKVYEAVTGEEGGAKIADQQFVSDIKSTNFTFSPSEDGASQKNGDDQDVISTSAVKQMSFLSKKYNLIMTGKGLKSADDLCGPEFWLEGLRHVCVFARLSPQQKEDIIRAIGGKLDEAHAMKVMKKDLGEGEKVAPSYSSNSAAAAKRAAAIARKKNLNHTLMCGDGGNDVGALKQADVGVALLSGFGNANVDVSAKKAAPPSLMAGLLGGGEEEEVDAESQGKIVVDDDSEDEGEELDLAGGEEVDKKKKKKTSSDKDAEDELAAIRNEEKTRVDAANSKIKTEFAKKQMSMAQRQTKLVEEEMAKRRANGEDCGVMAHTKVMTEVVMRMKRDMENERVNLQRQHGMGVGAGASSAAEKWVEQLEVQDDMNVQVKLGDASIAAPFTSRTPSIASVIDIIRQGRCTLLSSIQQSQIMMLDSMISAYSMSAMSADGARPAEQQLMASGMLISVASIAFSFARPLDKMHPVR